jgi:hypothetical protein
MKTTIRAGDVPPVDPHLLRLTAYPPGPGPYDRWEVTAEATGEVIAGGIMPIDEAYVREACDAYHRRIQAQDLS